LNNTYITPTRRRLMTNECKFTTQMKKCENINHIFARKNKQKYNMLNGNMLS